MLSHLTIKDYKLFSNSEFDFGSVVQISGENGSGKTSIKEAIEFLLSGKVNGKKPSGSPYVSGLFNGVKIIRKGTSIQIAARKADQLEVDALTGVSYEELQSIFGLEFMSLSDDKKHDVLISNSPNIKPASALLREWWDEYDQIGEGENDGSNHENGWDHLCDSYAMDVPEELEKELEKIVKNIRDDHTFKMGELHNVINNINSLGKLPKKKVFEELKQPKRSKKLIKLTNTFNKLNKNPFAASDKLLRKLGLKRIDEKELNAKMVAEKVKEETALRSLESLKRDKCPTCGQNIEVKNRKTLIKELEAEKVHALERYKRMSDVIKGYKKFIKIFNDRLSLRTAKLEKEHQKEMQEYLLKKKKQGGIEYKIKQRKTLIKQQRQLEEEIEKLDDGMLSSMLKFVRTIPFKQVEGVTSEIAQSLGKGFKITLYEKYKSTENFKKVFKLSKNGIDYNFLSYGQKMWVDFVFAKFLSKNKPNFKMFFFDNAESFTGKLSKPEGQIFISRVKKDQSLTVK